VDSAQYFNRGQDRFIGSSSLLSGLFLSCFLTSFID
jgi:hypothetical protein